MLMTEVNKTVLTAYLNENARLTVNVKRSSAPSILILWMCVCEGLCDGHGAILEYVTIEFQ